MLATPKKPRAVPVREETVAAVTAKLRTVRVATVATRLAEVEIDFTIKNLQALLDKSMEEYLPHIPRMIVTAKPFGMMKRRISEARVKNLKDFVDFTIREWTTLAGQNRMAFLRDPGKSRSGTALPLAPAFTALAYRLPYFLAAYASYAVRGAHAKKDDTAHLQKQIDRQNAIITSLRQDRQQAGAVIRRMRQAPLPQLRQSLPGATSDLGEVWIPEWSPKSDDKKGMNRGK